MSSRTVAAGGVWLLCVCCNSIFGIEDPRHRPEGTAGSSVSGESGSGGDAPGGRGGSHAGSGASSGTGTDAGAGADDGGSSNAGHGGSKAGSGTGAKGGAGRGGTGGSAGAGTGAVGGGGSGPGGASGSGGDAGAPTLSVAITTPSRTIHTNGTVHFEVEVEGDPDVLDLLVDGERQKRLGDARTYDWDTTGASEETHSVTARARFGTQTIESKARTVHVDRTAPKLKKRVPSPNAENVFIDDAITAEFSEELDADSLSADSVGLKVNGDTLPSTLTLSDDGKTITVAPAAKIVAPANLELSLSVELKDLAGNIFVGSESWSWDLPEWAQLGNVLGTPGTAVNECFLALRADGHPAIILSNVQGDGVLVYSLNGSTWDLVGEKIIPISGQAVTVGYLTDVAGTLTVALKQSDGTHANGYVVQWNGTSWAPLGGAINPLGNADIQDALPASNTSGELVVGVWQGEGGVAPFHGFMQRWNGTSWDALGGAFNAVPGGSVHLKPAIALDEAGQPFMAWGEKETTNYDDYVVTYEDGVGLHLLGGKINPTPGLNQGGQGLLSVSKTTGFPFVAMRADDDVPPNAYVMRWDGSDWVPIGGAINPVPGQTVTYGTKSFAITSDDIPVIAVIENNGNVAENGGAGTNNAYVVKWGGDQWETVGGAVNPIPGQNANRLRMTLDAADRPVISMLVSNEINNFCYVYRSNN